MSRATDPEPDPESVPSTDWTRIVAGLIGLVVGILIITWGIQGF